ncbi:hypothetical protein B2J93_2058 [Marssonina coronariae]|uniref:Uncharacterized protein n=1 Tax=Diplocarpon coronariae TaxID=2795749 RepID=A0A218Z8X2_9HELO|nr:hypothetical protein B2J93_2058 [Marssonina coronariae]
MASATPHRRRSKTPVFFVGQLERTPMGAAPARTEQHQAVLPLGLRSSFLEAGRAIRQRRLRKIKSQASLRALVRLHSQCSTPSSEAETLVGSPGPQSPADGDDRAETRLAFDRRPAGDDQQTLPLPADRADSIGLTICTELLTTELLRQQPDRASGLQILLLIEAYETAQQRLRTMLDASPVTGKPPGHVRAAEGILDHWLQALYAVYDRSQEEEGRTRQLCGEPATLAGSLFGDG